MDFDKGPLIDIRLLEPDIRLPVDGGNGGVLRGSVSITCRKSYTIQSLELLFEGFQYIITDGDRPLKGERKQIARHPVLLYPVSSNNTDADTAPDLLISPGTTQCTFESILPSHLPATIQCPELDIQYSLRATMHYNRITTTTSSNSTTSKPQWLSRKRIRNTACTIPVRLIAAPSSASLLYHNHGIDSLKQTTTWCQYRIAFEHRSITAGKTMGILLQMAPHLQGMWLEQVYIEWIERRRVSTQKLSKHLLLPIRWVQLDQSGQQHHTIATPPLRLGSHPRSFRLAYQVPEHLVPSTQFHDQFEMDHHVIVSMLLSFPAVVKCKNDDNKRYMRRYTKTIRFGTDIRVIDGRQDQDARLPPYQECAKSHGSSTLIMQGPPVYTP
ncbi:predicted protein [Lichtheimia corymbifera JMRC:FSU:9682]|uniref:Arrestin-like N-terminal domain-containing protein n=1 Tax=Lichtheimia corymbifera JMRC:FSU:9682 TaxID=1263082 RepID=A0A068RKY2_9FUNG|nr:predicted protein [Lichtheimia corymbifera JMRC:FSU:9682]